MGSGSTMMEKEVQRKENEGERERKEIWSFEERVRVGEEVWVVGVV